MPYHPAGGDERFAASVGSSAMTKQATDSEQYGAGERAHAPPRRYERAACAALPQARAPRREVGELGDVGVERNKPLHAVGLSGRSLETPVLRPVTLAQ